MKEKCTIIVQINDFSLKMDSKTDINYQVFEKSQINLDFCSICTIFASLCK